MSLLLPEGHMPSSNVSLRALVFFFFLCCWLAVWGFATEARTQTTPMPTGDSDGDGLPDGWEIAQFGNLAQGAKGDPDRDGYDNLTEFQIGTSPTDRLDAPVPAGTYFKYDASGRIVEKQITLE